MLEEDVVKAAQVLITKSEELKTERKKSACSLQALFYLVGGTGIEPVTPAV